MFKSVGWTWNPVTGCTHDCRYCWARSLTERWGKSFTPQFRSHFLEDTMPDDDSWIFVGSMGDLFCPGMKDEWILRIIHYIKDCKADNRFLLQTKNPFSFQAYYLELDRVRDKVVLGTTLETTGSTYAISNAPDPRERKQHLHKMKKAGFDTFLSLEPLGDFNPNTLIRWIAKVHPLAVELGFENYTNHVPRPPIGKLRRLVEYLDDAGYEYVLKKNVAEALEQEAEQ